MYLFFTLIVSIFIGFLLAWFCGVETGIYRLNPLRLHLSIRSGDARAIRLYSLTRDQRQTLIGMFLIGTNLCSYLIASIVAGYFTYSGYSELQAEIWTTVTLAPILFIFTEAIPKNCFFLRANDFMLRSSGFIYVVYYVFKYSGMIYLFNGIIRVMLYLSSSFSRSSEGRLTDWSRLGELVKEGFSVSSFSTIQADIAEKILQLSSKRIDVALIPLDEVFALPVDISVDEFILQLKSKPYTRVPVYADYRENIVGVVNVYNVFLGPEGCSVKEFSNSVPKIRIDEYLVNAIDILRRQEVKLAVVVDFAGRTLGIVTLKDLLDEVIGEI